MSRKIYLLTELEQEIINQRRVFNQQLIKENTETQLLLNQKNDEHAVAEMRKMLARGERVDIAKNMHPHRAPIDDIIFYIKKFFGCTK
jgi:hypothetical protein